MRAAQSRVNEPSIYLSVGAADLISPRLPASTFHRAAFGLTNLNPPALQLCRHSLLRGHVVRRCAAFRR